MSKSADKKSKKQSMARKRTWKLFDKGSTILAGVVASQLSSMTWRAATGKKPPTSPKDPEVRLAEAVTWAALAGATIELSKILISRKAVDYWVRSTGELPPGVKPNKASNPTEGQTPAT
ncbi:DUF4235 domain-containing protein [Solicola gregarius]|uniref:DUF4235 domain-containing protein n=1 Tax=Solicola gregarius TaxID=2908642 RepID=A0AA46THA2_9ACTN|nr:DUF4235 domain-containing protein [Solicola gregarius]UYM05260.1 DUF4235 domain-containing protein [Solicola gregarius]